MFANKEENTDNVVKMTISRGAQMIVAREGGIGWAGCANLKMPCNAIYSLS